MSKQRNSFSPSLVINEQLTLNEGIWETSSGGYWSNIAKADMEEFLKDLDVTSTRGVVKKHFPHLEEVIFSAKRTAGIGLLEFKKTDVVIDAGCMWGALAVPIARTGCQVIGIDQTMESLRLHYARSREEGLDNLSLVRANLNQVGLHPQCADKVIINGVLEWLPEGSVELSSYLGKKKTSKDHGIDQSDSPMEIQLNFLKKVRKALKKDGVLYLAIENRFDVANFFGAKDPHTGQRFVTFLPRFLQNLRAKFGTGRPYLTWTYSRSSLKKLLCKAGYRNIQIRYAFPEYRFPEYILTENGMKKFMPVRYIHTANIRTKIFWYVIETVFFKWLKMASLAPCFIVMAEKDESS